MPDTIQDQDDDIVVGTGTFDQTAVNSIVRQRLQRQRARYETQIAELSKRTEELDKLLTTATADVKKYDALFTKSLESKVKALPEPIQKLLAKMSLADQAAWLEENPDIAPEPKKTIPLTPKPTGKAAMSDEERIARKRQSGNYNV